MYEKELFVEKDADALVRVWWLWWNFCMARVNLWQKQQSKLKWYKSCHMLQVLLAFTTLTTTATRPLS